MNRTFTVELTANQMKYIAEACEVMARIQMGQVHEIVNILPLKPELTSLEKQGLKDRLSQLMTAVLPNSMDGYCTSFSVGHPILPESNGVLWGVADTFNYEVYTEEAIDRGYIKQKGERNWKQMISNKYDEPRQHGNEPLPKVTSKITVDFDFTMI